jgi:hypothetical protein
LIEMNIYFKKMGKFCLVIHTYTYDYTHTHPHIHTLPFVT